MVVSTAELIPALPVWILLSATATVFFMCNQADKSLLLLQMTATENRSLFYFIFLQAGCFPCCPVQMHALPFVPSSRRECRCFCPQCPRHSPLSLCADLNPAWPKCFTTSSSVSCAAPRQRHSSRYCFDDNCGLSSGPTHAEMVPCPKAVPSPLWNKEKPACIVFCSVWIACGRGKINPS